MGFPPSACMQSSEPWPLTASSSCMVAKWAPLQVDRPLLWNGWINKPCLWLALPRLLHRLCNVALLSVPDVNNLWLSTTHFYFQPGQSTQQSSPYPYCEDNPTIISWGCLPRRWSQTREIKRHDEREHQFSRSRSPSLPFIFHWQYPQPRRFHHHCPNRSSSCLCPVLTQQHE